MQPWELRAWFEEFLDACNRHDVDAIGEFLDPAVRRSHRPAGAKAWIDDLDELFRAFPDWRWRRILLVVEDDRVASHVRGSGTHRGAYRGIPAAGAHVNVAEFAFYRVTGGRITESTASGDRELLAQLRS
jgi:predicted ester cyclase